MRQAIGTPDRIMLCLAVVNDERARLKVRMLLPCRLLNDTLVDCDILAGGLSHERLGNRNAACVMIENHHGVQLHSSLGRRWR